MPHKTRFLVLPLNVLCVLVLLCALAPGDAGGQYFDIPKPLPPEEYGNIVIDRVSTRGGQKPVAFSHWIHRRKHTCRVCHFELEFNMKAGTTEITEAANRAGRFCGACHDGKEHGGSTLFGHEKPYCAKCHTGDRGSGKERFPELAGLPKNNFGNKVDWAAALDKGLIRPEAYLKVPGEGLSFDKTLTLEAEWVRIPPAVFPHGVHIKWLDCNNCHPDIFNIKKKTTKHFLMTRILKGEFCGVCHLNVAFPMDDCKRCHPKKR